MVLTELSCRDFADELAAKKPVPGEGELQHLHGALGVPLSQWL